MRGFTNLLLILGLAFIIIPWSIILYPNFWSKLRSLGLPVPYCTTNSLALGCEYKSPVSYAYINKIVTADPVVVMLTGSEPVDFLNELCTHSREGGNVLAIVYPDAKDLITTLTSCGVKVKRGNAYYTLAVSPAGLLVMSDYLSLFTDCNDAVNYHLIHIKGRWSRLP